MPVAMVTGTSSGIGLGTAVLFGRRGHRVLAGARRPEEFEALQRAVAEDLTLTPLVLDVDDDRSVRETVALSERERREALFRDRERALC